MIFNDQLKKAERVVTANGPAILTAVGVAGTVATAVLTARAAWKASRIVEDHESAKRIKSEDPLTKVEKVQLCWQLFVIPTTVAVGTCAAIVMAQRINAKRAAALMAGYAVLESRYSEYTDKAKQALGVNKDKKIRDEMAEERFKKQSPDVASVILMSGEQVFHEAWTGRPLPCTMEKLKRAENDMNARLIRDDAVSLSSLYDMLGLAHTSESDNFGWNRGTIELKPTAIMHTDEAGTERAVISFDYDPAPSPEFWRYV
jgi:hypothetical protein